MTIMFSGGTLKQTYIRSLRNAIDPNSKNPFGLVKFQMSFWMNNHDWRVFRKGRLVRLYCIVASQTPS